jgi:hypothetical protein
MATFDQLFKVLSDQAKVSFKGVAVEFDKGVLPAMASLAQNLVTIQELKATNNAYTNEMALADFQEQLDAAASVLIRFANATLLAVQNVLNALISAVATILNKLVGFPLIPIG